MKMKKYNVAGIKKLAAVVGGAMVLSLGTNAMATTIEYATPTHVGNHYTMEFTVKNDTLPTNIDWFSIKFGQTSDGLDFTNTDEFSNFTPDDAGAPQNGWLAYSYEPSAINLPGEFDGDGGTGIAPGGESGPFTVSFDWTGVGSLDHLYFTVGDFPAATTQIWNELDHGFTVAKNVNPVPEPATMLLLGTGLAGLLGARRKKSTR